MINERDFTEWLQHPVTAALKEALERKREDLRQDWEGGSFTDYTKEGTALVNVGNIGTCRGLAWVQELDYETLIGVLADEK